MFAANYWKPFSHVLTFSSVPIIDVSSKNLDSNERGYSLMGKPEDMHTWFFLYDEGLRNPEIIDNEAHNLIQNSYNVGYGSVGSGGFKKVRIRLSSFRNFSRNYFREIIFKKLLSKIFRKNFFFETFFEKYIFKKLFSGNFEKILLAIF
jgi:hypothetical protein